MEILIMEESDIEVFEEMVNRKIRFLEHNGFKIIDIKYSKSSAVHSVMIIMNKN